MITAETFEMIETVTREALERHPVWTHFREDEDRELILAWGVPAAALDAEIERYAFCGPQPLFPVLELDPLPRRPHLIIAARFDSASGNSMPGYLLEPHAFGIFARDRELCFNRNLPGLSMRAAAALGSALGEDPERLFPLRYVSGLRREDGAPIEGDLGPFW